MKKILFLSLFISLNVFGQSITIKPSDADFFNSGHTLKTVANAAGYSHNDGTATFRNWMLPYPEKTVYVGSVSNHPFALTSFGGTPQIFLKNTGIGLGFIHLSPTDGTVGNIGIRLPSSTVPTYPLDVNGRIRLRNNGGNNTSGIWYDNSLGAERVFVGMETDDLFGFYGTPGWSFRFNATNGNVGISTVPTSNKLEVNGTIGSSSLAGTGNNQLYANSTGTIIATAPVAFSVKSNTALIPIATITTTTFPFDTENYDEGSFFNNATHEFTAPLKGIYHFDSAVTFGIVNSANSFAIYNMSFVVDGGTGDAKSTQDLEVGGYKTLTLSKDYKLNAGQKVKISVYQSSGATLNLIGQSDSYFTGHLVTRL